MLTDSDTVARAAMTVDLADLGAVVSEEFAGILIPRQDLNEAKVGITDQFLKNAATYAERYSAVGYFKRLIENALCVGGRPSPRLILDFGSGSGNSVFPCLELFPDAEIIATDLSENLLAILRDHVATNHSFRNRLSLVCVDATKPYFAENCADIVIGAAILHHLIDPAACVKSACRALRPGGKAIFFEPFEAGNAVLRLAYEDVLRLDKLGAMGEKLDPLAVHLFSIMLNDYKARAGLNENSPLLKQLDDKWLFTRAYFEDILKSLPGVSVEIAPLNGLERPFSAQTETNLRLGLGISGERAREIVPQWAWDIFASYDESFSIELKRDLPVEACIIFERIA